MTKAPYKHKFKSYGELTSMLLKNGMTGDPGVIQKRLEDVGYQRLQAYWAADIQNQCSTDFDTIWTRYCFDRQIRLLLMDAIERIEVAVRSRFVHHFCEKHGPFGYLKSAKFPHCQKKELSSRQRKLSATARKSSLKLVQEFFAHYKNKKLPMWLACELMDFGTTVFLYSAAERSIKTKVSKALGAPNPLVLESWLRALNDVRNACAHHNRVWNRQWVKTLPIPTKQADWHAQLDPATMQWKAGSPTDLAFDMTKTGGVLTLCHHLLKRTASNSRWKERLFALFAEDRFSSIPHHWMGLPSEWQSHPLWKN